MPRIVVSPLAQADIDEIWDYIARDNIRNADRFVDRLEQRLGVLAANPRLGVARDDLRPGLLQFGHTRYLIYYRLIRRGIEVVRVVHGARDQRALWRRLLGVEVTGDRWFCEGRGTMHSRVPTNETTIPAKAASLYDRDSDLVA